MPRRGWARLPQIHHPGRRTAAIEALDGTKLEGRALKVNEAEERASAAPSHHRRELPMDLPTKRVDDRPTDEDGKKIVYKGI